MDQENDCTEAPAQSPTTEQNNEGAENKSSEKNSAEADNPNEKPIKAESSKKPTLKSLKAKSQVKKKSSASISLGTENVKGNSVQQNNRRNNKKLSQGNRAGKSNDGENEKNQNSGVGESNDAENGKNQTSRGAKRNDDENGKDRNSREEKLEKDVTNKEPTRKSQEIHKNREKISDPSRNQNDHRNEEINGGKRKRSWRRKRKGKLDEKENTQGDERKKEKLGGLIFMCNAKTKPDCFRYQVMGVTNNKKDVVLGVRPGLKLFLYDFDLRLMYGIYKASSSGGMRLEPKAFGGSFPVQVRFSIYKDCLPLPESVFKKAIKDNDDKNYKFDTELTVRQTRKLSDLFRPAVFPSVQTPAVAVHSPVRATVWGRGIPDNGVARVNTDSGSYPVVSHERDRLKERAPNDLYMSGKEYRTYGLQRERRNLTPPRVSASLDTYQRDIEREHLYRQPAPPYTETVLLHGESIPADPLYLSQRELQSYDFAGRSVLPSAAPSVSAVASGSSVGALDTYARDPYRTYPYSTSSASEYLLPQRSKEVSSGSYYVDGRRDVYLAASDPLCRRETDEVDRLYLKYSVDPPADYNHEYQGAKQEAMLPPVSSRYSFAGPSMSYRQ